MATDVVMPQMGESIAEGTITKWQKNVGDHVDRDEPLFEISTDKVDAEIPSPAAGTLTEIKFKEGETVEVNTVVAVLDGNGAKPATAEPQVAKEQETPEPTQAASPPPAPPPPQIERPKPIITTVEQGAPKAATGKTEVKPLIRREESFRPRETTSPATARDRGTATADELRQTKSSPLVRKIAEEHGIDIRQLEGTGMSGRVTKNDILSFIESGAPAAAPTAPRAPVPAQPTPSVPTPATGAPSTQPIPTLKPAEGDRVEQMSVMRKKIAEHMVLSRRTSAHVTTVYEVDMTKVAKLRDENRDAFQERTG